MQVVENGGVRERHSGTARPAVPYATMMSHTRLVSPRFDPAMRAIFIRFSRRWIHSTSGPCGARQMGPRYIPNLIRSRRHRTKGKSDFHYTLHTTDYHHGGQAPNIDRSSYCTLVAQRLVPLPGNARRPKWSIDTEQQRYLSGLAHLPCRPTPLCITTAAARH